jgi:hypothetical protein
MIFEPLQSFALHYRDGREVTVRAPKGCHLRVIDDAWGRPTREGDVVRVEEIEGGLVNVAADYIHDSLSWYETNPENVEPAA